MLQILTLITYKKCNNKDMNKIFFESRNRISQQTFNCQKHLPITISIIFCGDRHENISKYFKVFQNI
jgi:hypothetical protein